MRTLFALLLLLCSSPAWAAIDCADANKVEFYDATPTDPEAIAYTVPSVTNRITFVAVGTRTGTQRTMTITGAGATWTEVDTPLFSGAAAGLNFYYALNATAGATTIGVDYNTVPLADFVLIWTCSGVNQSTPFRTVANGAATDNSPTATATGVLTSDVVIGVFAADMSSSTANDPTEGANQTTINLGNDGGEIRGAASYQAGADGGVMSWSYDSIAQQWAAYAMALVPVSTGRHIGPLVSQ